MINHGVTIIVVDLVTQAKSLAFANMQRLIRAFLNSEAGLKRRIGLNRD